MKVEYSFEISDKETFVVSSKDKNDNYAILYFSIDKKGIWHLNENEFEYNLNLAILF